MLARFRKTLALGAALSALALSAPAGAQENPQARIDRLQREVEELRRAVARQDTADVAALRRQIEAITREIEEMKLGREVAAVAADTSIYGLAPAASKVYRVQQGVSVGGYGEFLYENFSEERENGAPSNAVDQFDALRAILYFGYKFNDRLIFNSELEWEHGSTSQGGEASIEFAYLDYILSPALGVRAGLLLSPLGLTNELHEPPIFLGTTRPLTESVIIPTTWRANGAGIFGDAGPFSYRAYLMTTLDAVGGGTSRAGGFSAGGLRGGRQKGAREMAENFGGVARVDFVGVPGVLVGGSAFLGNTAQGRELPTGEEVEGRLTIWEAHADVKLRGLDLRALYAVATLDDVAELNRLRNLTGSQSIGERLTGGYVQAGYDVLNFVDTEHQLVPYFRWERVNTQDRVPAGFSINPATDRGVFALGAMWKPIPAVSVKGDYQMHSNEADTGVNQFNVNIAYLF
ncbi:MAG TPA: hypothetical protein VGR37_16015 [Longimicrobiaceae bacterium]|nr:hypothetical protein [Longimicrobiaceae bacterium]